jgi:hypothetical protein
MSGRSRSRPSRFTLRRKYPRYMITLLIRVINYQMHSPFLPHLGATPCCCCVACHIPNNVLLPITVLVMQLYLRDLLRFALGYQVTFLKDSKVQSISKDKYRKTIMISNKQFKCYENVSWIEGSYFPGKTVGHFVLILE